MPAAFENSAEGSSPNAFLQGDLIRGNLPVVAWVPIAQGFLWEARWHQGRGGAIKTKCLQSSVSSHHNETLFHVLLLLKNPCYQHCSTSCSTQTAQPLLVLCLPVQTLSLLVATILKCPVKNHLSNYLLSHLNTHRFLFVFRRHLALSRRLAWGFGVWRTSTRRNSNWGSWWGVRKYLRPNRCCGKRKRGVTPSHNLYY